VLLDANRLSDVDAHVVEPANLWSSRLPAKYREVGPHIEYLPPGKPKLQGGSYIEEPGTEGPDCAWWFYEDHRYSIKRLIAEDHAQTARPKRRIGFLP